MPSLMIADSPETPPARLPRNSIALATTGSPRTPSPQAAPLAWPAPVDDETQASDSLCIDKEDSRQITNMQGVVFGAAAASVAQAAPAASVLEDSEAAITDMINRVGSVLAGKREASKAGAAAKRAAKKADAKRVCKSNAKANAKSSSTPAPARAKVPSGAPSMPPLRQHAPIRYGPCSIYTSVKDRKWRVVCDDNRRYDKSFFWKADGRDAWDNLLAFCSTKQC